MTSIISEKITEEERDELAMRYHLLLDSGRMFETYPDAKGYFDADVKNDEIMMDLIEGTSMEYIGVESNTGKFDKG